MTQPDTEQLLAEVCGDELSRIVCNFRDALRGRSRGLFEPATDPAGNWLEWIEEMFRPCIGKVVADAHSLAACGRFDRIAAIGSEFELRLSDELVARGREAGGAAMKRLAWPDRRRLPISSESNSMSQLPVVFGMHTGLFHIPRMQVLHGYLFLEGAMAIDGLRASDSSGFLAAITATLGKCTPAIDVQPIIT